MSKQVSKKGRVFKNKLFVFFSILATLFSLAWLAWILGVIAYKGFAGLSLAVFTELVPAPDSEGGGLANALVGSLIILAMAVVLGTPLGILGGVYLAEYGKTSKFAEFMRIVNDVLLSAPSIVMGLFVYGILVRTTGNYSAFAGAFALALIQIPVIIRTTENMLNLVPNTLRESAFALGIPKYKMIMHISIKASISGIITGFLLSLARIAGETGPLLFTSLNNQYWNLNVFDGPMASLPMVIYKFALSPYENWQQLAWTGVLIITIFIFVLNIIARLITLSSVKK